MVKADVSDSGVWTKELDSPQRCSQACTLSTKEGLGVSTPLQPRLGVFPGMQALPSNPAQLGSHFR